MTTSDTLRGRVQARNGTGIRVGPVWAQVSKFKPVDLPEVGADVSVGVDAKGFITEITVIDMPVAPRSTVGRDATITRLSVLKSAAVFLGQLSQTREEVRAEHVLVLADKWLAWVESDPTSKEPEF